MGFKGSILIIIVLFFLLINIVFAKDYSDSKTLVLDVNIKNSFYLDYSSKSYLEGINVTLQSYPKNDERQLVLHSSFFPNAFVPESSNDFVDGIGFYFKDKIPKYDIYANYSIKTQYKVWNIQYEKFPIDKLDNKFSVYLKETEIIDITPEIYSIAAGISQQTNDLFELEYMLAEYVRRNIHYDLITLTADVSQKSSWVLRNNIGVCDELTNLFISFNRALGIPARFVSGYAYTELDVFESNWVPHAWAEVYFPNYGWIPFDVTYGQYGMLDSGHIKMNYGIDGSGSAVKYDYIGRNINLKPDILETNINVVLEGQTHVPAYNFEVKMFDDEVGFNSYNLVEVSLINPENYYLTADLYLANTKGIKIFEESTEKILNKTIHRKIILLKPLERKKVYWLVKVDDVLDKNYYYTYPIIVYNSLNQTKETQFISRYGSDFYDYSLMDNVFRQNKKDFYKEYSYYENNTYTNIDISCEYPKIILQKEYFIINCTLDNRGDKEISLKACLYDDCKDIDLGIQYKNVEFTKKLAEIGIHNIAINFYSKNISLNYNKSLPLTIQVIDEPSVIIKKIFYPEKVKFNEQFSVEILLEKNSFTIPKNLTAILESNTFKNEWYLEDLNGEKKLILTTDGKSLKPNNNTFNFLIKYNDDYGNNYYEEETFNIYSEANFFEKIILFLNQLAFYFERK
ncbi:MAG: transglutaminase domain-containing protein [Candidatus Woesearchaeota archaeon]